MNDLIQLILKHQGNSTDYRIEIEGVRVVPLGVELKITHLPSKEQIEVAVP
jgi:hypothetical protein